MPLYSSRCRVCGYKGQFFAKIESRDIVPPCELCASEADRILDAPRVAPDLAGYECPVTGQWIEGRRAHEENLRRQGCRILEPGESREAMRQQAAEDDAQLEAIAETAAKTVASWAPEKQERLANELSHGLDVDFVRQ